MALKLNLPHNRRVNAFLPDASIFFADPFAYETPFWTSFLAELSKLHLLRRVLTPRRIRFRRFRLLRLLQSAAPPNRLLLKSGTGFAWKYWTHLG